MILKLRVALLILAIVPATLVFGMTYEAPLGMDKNFIRAEAVGLVSALVLALALPGVLLNWLLGPRLAILRQFCQRVKQGHYDGFLAVPTEARDGDGEDELLILMRDMNWMARQIEMREGDLQQAVASLTQSQQHNAEQNEALAATNAELLAAKLQLQTRTEELEQALRQMQVMAMTDPLTALANRRCFFERLDRQFAAFSCQCHPLSLVVIDADRFKSINDTYGHEAGDRVLLTIAEIIQKSIRESDLVARIGGEEYALLLPEAGVQEAVAIAERIRQAVEKHDFRLPLHPPGEITISIGICTLTQQPCMERDRLFHYADQALYESKHRGRNSISLYDVATQSIVKAACA